MTWSFATSGSLPAFREICLILMLGAFGPLFAGTTLFQASVPISGDFVPARLELEQQQQDLVLFTLDIPPNEGDLLGLFGNISDEGLLGQLSIFDPNGIITDFEFKANSVKQVGGGNNVNPAKNWDFGLKLGRQGSGSGVVQHATFGLAAPGLTVEHFTQALNQGWIFGVRTQSTNGPEGSSKMGIGPGDLINRPPVITSLPPDSTDACSEYLLTLDANDPDGDPISWSLIQGPAGMVINANFLSWKPGLDQQGSFPVSILADDSQGGTALLDFSLTVQPPTGQAPAFSELPQGPLNIGVLYELAPLAIDPDGDALSYTPVQAPEGLSIQDNGLSWTPQEHQTGDFTLEIQVTDGCFLVGLTSVLHVNAPPQVSVTVPEMVHACELFSLVLTGSDPDQDPLTWTLLQGPEGMILQNDRLIWQPTLGQQATYLISLGVEDGQGGFARQDSTLTVLPALGQAPVFATLPESLDVGQGLTINPLATDADGDELSFTALQIPEGMILENNSLAWTPLENQVGIFPVSLEATDGCFTVQLNTQIQVIQPNRPPEITSTAPDSFPACELFSYTLSATDPDGDSLVYSLLQGPEAMVLQGETISWVPTYDRQGSFPVSVLVQDGQGLSAQQDFDLTVLPPLGQAPVFAALPETLEVGQILSLDPLATDADGDELSFTALQIPEGLILENNSLSWTPQESQVGIFTLSLEVTDGCFTVQLNTQIQVIQPNRPPEITSTAPDSIPACELFSYTLSATDPDGDSLAYSLLQGPEAMVLQGDTLSWVPTYDRQGIFPVSILVQDGQGLSAQQHFDLTVLPPLGQAPVFAALPETLEVGQILSLEPLATDADGDEISFTILQIPEGLILENNSLSWTPQESQLGIFTLSLEVTDGCFTVQLNTQIQVIQPNRPPEITSSAPNSIPACELFSYTLSATDPDGDSLVYSLLKGPEAMVLQGETISWVPTYDRQGSFPVSVLVQDGQGLSAQQDFDLTVLPPLGQAPVFAALPETLEVGQIFSLDPLATDADGDELSFTVLQIPEGLILENNSLSWTPLGNQAGTFPISLEVTDGCFNVQLSSQVTVVPSGPNGPPVIVSPPITVAHQGQPYRYQAVAVDPDQDTLEWHLQNGPPGMQIDAQTGIVGWTPAGRSQSKAEPVPLKADLLFLSTTLRVDGPEIRAAQELGYSYMIVSPETWRTMKKEDFKRFRAIVLGDPNSRNRGLISAAEETVGIWGPIVTGNVIVFGGDPSDHLEPAYIFVRNALKFAAADTGWPGAVIFLSEYYDNSEPFTPIPVLDAFEPGAFSIGGAHCHNDIILTASHPVLDELTDELMSDWSCSAHSAFQTWGRDFRVLAMARDLGVTYTAPNGEQGTPHLLARGRDLRLISQMDLFPVRQDWAVGGYATLQVGLVDGDRPLENAQVVLDVLEGPHAGLRFLSTSDSEGLATFELLGEEEGVDTVQAWFVDSHGRVQKSDYATLRWSQAQVVDAGISVTDNISGSDYQDWQITVFPPGDYAPSQFVSIPTLQARAGENWSYVFDVRDSSGGQIPARLDHAPLGMVLDPQAHRLDFVPTFDQLGEVVVSLAAGPEETTQWFVLQVGRGPNQAPYFVSHPPLQWVEMGNFVYQIDARDPEGDPITLQLDQAPQGMVLSNKALYWNRPLIGSHPVRLVATDPSGQSVLQEWLLEITPNSPPEILSTPVLFAFPGREYSSPLIARDPEGGSIYMNLEQFPVGMRLSIDKLLWTPTVDQVGQHPVRIRFRDSSQGISYQEFVLTVSADNHPPRITSTPGPLARVGSVYSYQAQAVDEDGDPLIFQLDELPDYPSNLTFDPASGLLTLIPESTLETRISISVMDPAGARATQSFILRPRVNQPPYFQNLPAPSTVQVGQTVNFLTSPRDPDGDPLSIGFEQAPEGMTVTNYGSIYWKPTPDQTGWIPVSLWVADPYLGRSTISFEVFVNQAPIWQTTAPTVATEGEPFQYAARASDPDGGPVYYQLSSSLEGITLDVVTGLVTWIPAANASGIINIAIDAFDLQGGSTRQVTRVTVAEALNLPPSFSFTPSETATEGLLYQDSASALDPDRDRLTWILDSGPAGLSLSTYGLIRWTPAADQAGVHPVSLRVTDGRGGEATQSFLITVSEALNLPPEITSTPQLTALARREYVYNLEATDPDGEVVQFELLAGPQGMILSLAGQLRWLPDNSQTGPQVVQILAFDPRGGSDEQTFQIEVTNLGNNPPVFASEPETFASNGSHWVYYPEIIDAEGDPVTLSLLEGPADMVLTGSQLNWTASLPGTWVTLEASDSLGATSHQRFRLNVTARANTAPEIISQPILSAQAGLPYFYDVEHDDPDGFPILYRLDQAPAGMTIEPGTGRISWQPDLSDLGNHQVTLRVTDGPGAYDTQTFNLNVTDPGDILPPQVFINIPKTSYLPDEVVILTLATQDENGLADLVLSINDQTLELNSNQQATFSTSQPGVYLVKAIATDTSGNQNHHEIEFRIEAPDDQALPEVVIHAPVEGQELSAPAEVIITVQDQNLAEWFLEVSPVGKECWTEIARGQEQISRGLGGLLDTSLMPNGMYHLRLTAFDVNFLGSQDTVGLIVDGNFKIGRFEVGFQDLNIPLRGIPVQLNRLYDSTNKCPGEFGFGWNMAKPDIRANITPGLRWTLDQQVFCLGPSGAAKYPPYDECDGVQLPYYCIADTLTHYFTVTLPGGETETFDLTMDAYGTAQPCNELVVPEAATPILTPRQGVTSKLEILTGGHVFFRLMSTEQGPRYQMIDFDFEPWNPQRFRLTTAEGIIYTIHREDGLESITDLEGNVVTYTPTAIRHSSGTEITLARDNQGRITRATDPEGSFIQYSYDDRGDLVAVTDRRGFTTRYTYDDYHNLIRVTDPEGNSPVRMYYDEDGRLIAQEDFYGNRIEMDHDIEGRQEVITDRRGYQTTYVYDDRGNVLSKTDPVGSITRYTYDNNDNETSITTAYGTPLEATITRTFDDKRNILSETDGRGFITNFQYDNKQNPLSIRDQDGRGFGLTYDDSGQPTSLTDSLGNQTQLEYSWDRQGYQITKTTDPMGHVTETKNSRHGVIWEKSPLGGEANTTYDRNSRVTRSELGRINVDGSKTQSISSFKYDKNGNLIQEIDPQGAITTYQYDGNNRRIAMVDPQGNRTETRYDAIGNEIGILFADGTQTQITYDENANAITHTDQAGRVTTTFYDAANRVETVQYADGTQTNTQYDAAGNIAATINQRGHETAYTYDVNGNRTSLTDPLGNLTQYEYNLAGNLIRFTDAKGHTTHYQYDLKNRVTETRFHDGTRTQTIFDKLDRAITQIDQAGVATHFEYDAQSRLTKVIDALGNQTGYRYDSEGNQTHQIDALGRTTRWTYDSLGRQTTRTLPLGQVERLNYNLLGQMTSRIDFNGQEISYSYDKLNRLTRKDLPDDTPERITYTLTGQRARVLDHQGETSYTYDTMDRLARIDCPNGTWVSYTYDEAGNRTALETPYGTTQFSFDALNRLEQVTDAQGGLTRYTYDEVGNRDSLTHANGVTTQYQYDPLNRLTTLETRTTQGNLLNSYNYQLGSTGNRIGVLEANGRLTSYGYDALYRLIREQYTDPNLGGSTITYQYDAVGNRLEKNDSGTLLNYSYDENDRLLSEGNKSYTYDQNGNTLEIHDGAQTTSYAWNTRNRMVGAILPIGDILEFTYDIDGIRQSKSVNGLLTEYLIDPNRDYQKVIAELQDGQLSTTYTLGDNRISLTRGTETYYYHADGHGSITSLTNAAQQTVATNTYDAWGNLLATTGQIQNNFTYTGEQFDQDLGLYYLRARYMSSPQGRFVGMDSWEGNASLPLTLHKYNYVHQNPVTNIDPSGNETLIGEMNTLNIENKLQTSAVNSMRGIFKKFGCEIILIVGQEAVEQGIYVLIDSVGGGLYVGKTTRPFEVRLKEHIYEAQKAFKHIWKANAQILLRFKIPGGPESLAKAEQLLMDLVKDVGESLNKRNAISRRTKAQKEAFNKFRKTVCSK